jgi:hypothetical protein
MHFLKLLYLKYKSYRHTKKRLKEIKKRDPYVYK